MVPGMAGFRFESSFRSDTIADGIFLALSLARDSLHLCGDERFSITDADRARSRLIVAYLLELR